MSQKRLLIVGGVAGGASCAARLRRLDEKAEIVVFEKGPYPSFANCGLPYYIGDVISDEAKLPVATPDLFRTRFNIEVRAQHEVFGIHREEGKIEVKDLRRGSVYQEAYDALVLSPGAVPVRPPLPGIDLAGVFTLRTIPDSRAIREWIQRSNAKIAVIVGGGFIGLEMAENLTRRGLNVAIVEMLDQVMPPLDHEMAEYVHIHLLDNHVSIHLGDAIARFEGTDPTSPCESYNRMASPPATYLEATALGRCCTRMDCLLSYHRLMTMVITPHKSWNFESCDEDQPIGPLGPRGGAKPP